MMLRALASVVLSLMLTACSGTDMMSASDGGGGGSVGDAGPDLSAIADADTTVYDFAMPDLNMTDLNLHDGSMPDRAGCESSHFCPNKISCPCQEPANFSACTVPSQSCFYESCTFACFCFPADNQFHCCADSAPACPFAAPADGSFCCSIGAACPYDCNKGMTPSCICQNDHTWQCKMSACAVDMGIKG